MAPEILLSHELTSNKITTTQIGSGIIIGYYYGTVVYDILYICSLNGPPVYS